MWLGGGAYLSFELLNKQAVLVNNHLIHFKNVTFDSNCAEVGGGVHFFADKSTVPNHGNRIIFENCTWSKNYALTGFAAHLNPSPFSRLLPGVRVNNGTPVNCVSPGALFTSEFCTSSVDLASLAYTIYSLLVQRVSQCMRIPVYIHIFLMVKPCHTIMAMSFRLVKCGLATPSTPLALWSSAGGPLAFTLPLGRPASTQPGHHRIRNAVANQSGSFQIDQSAVKDQNKQT